MKRLGIIFILLLTFFVTGCGDSTRNDQGVSFTFFGWFDDIAGATNVTGHTIPFSSEAGGLELLSFAGLQNNLLGQGIRLQRMKNEYFIPGATISIPDTSTSLTGILGQGGPIETSTLPDAFPAANISYSGVAIITTSIGEYLILNREFLPDLPFTMTIRSTATGVTTAGKTLESNPVTVDVVFTSDIAIGGL